MINDLDFKKKTMKKISLFNNNIININDNSKKNKENTILNKHKSIVKLPLNTKRLNNSNNIKDALYSDYYRDSNLIVSNRHMSKNSIAKNIYPNIINNSKSKKSLNILKTNKTIKTNCLSNKKEFNFTNDIYLNNVLTYKEINDNFYDKNYIEENFTMKHNIIGTKIYILEKLLGLGSICQCFKTCLKDINNDLIDSIKKNNLVSTYNLSAIKTNSSNLLDTKRRLYYHNNYDDQIITKINSLINTNANINVINRLKSSNKINDNFNIINNNNNYYNKLAVKIYSKDLLKNRNIKIKLIKNELKINKILSELSNIITKRINYSLKNNNNNNNNDKIDNKHLKLKLKKTVINNKTSRTNIVNFDHYYENDLYLFAFYEYCSNKTLLDLINKRKTLSEFEVKIIVNQLLNCVGFIHNKNIVHKNITLSSLYLDEKMNLKLGKFEYSEQFKFKEQRFYNVCGDINYMSPEMINLSYIDFNNINEYKEKTINNLGYNYLIDYWNIGIITYVLLFGEFPFKVVITKNYNIDNNINSKTNDNEFNDYNSNSILDCKESIIINNNYLDIIDVNVCFNNKQILSKFEYFNNLNNFYENTKYNNKSKFKIKILNNLKFPDNCYSEESTENNIVSKECLDFISKLLEFDINKRLSVEETLNHPFLNYYLPSTLENYNLISPHTLEYIRSYIKHTNNKGVDISKNILNDKSILKNNDREKLDNSNISSNVESKDNISVKSFMVINSNESNNKDAITNNSKNSVNSKLNNQMLNESKLSLTLQNNKSKINNIINKNSLNKSLVLLDKKITKLRNINTLIKKDKTNELLPVSINSVKTNNNKEKYNFYQDLKTFNFNKSNNTLYIKNIHDINQFIVRYIINKDLNLIYHMSDNKYGVLYNNKSSVHFNNNFSYCIVYNLINKDISEYINEENNIDINTINLNFAKEKDYNNNSDLSDTFYKDNYKKNNTIKQLQVYEIDLVKENILKDLYSKEYKNIMNKYEERVIALIRESYDLCIYYKNKQDKYTAFFNSLKVKYKEKYNFEYKISFEKPLLYPKKYFYIKLNEKEENNENNIKSNNKIMFSLTNNNIQVCPYFHKNEETISYILYNFKTKVLINIDNNYIINYDCGLFSIKKNLVLYNKYCLIKNILKSIKD